eukprot:jgi/Tetstr1/436477/TSEL_025305.t1
MPLHRFKYIRSLVKYTTAHVNETVADPWAWFRRGVVEFNLNRAAVQVRGVHAILDETMSASQPRNDKLGNLPNISYVHRKPKPLGTEFKTLIIRHHVRTHTLHTPCKTLPVKDFAELLAKALIYDT